MKHWWVPGLQIGYEHTFIHQFADFLEGAATGKPRVADIPRGSRDRLRDGCGAEVGEESTVGNRVECRRQRDMRSDARGKFSARRSSVLVKSCPVSIVFDKTLAPGRGSFRPK